MNAPDAHGPVHQSGTFNIEAFIGGRWHGGMNRLTRESAIETAQSWAKERGSRHRVFDLDGGVIFDTESAAAVVDDRRCHCCGESIARCRETYRGMIAHIDVLAELRRQGVTGKVYYAVAELIEAAQGAYAVLGLNGISRRHGAQQDLRAALSRCGGRN
ncbi:MAG TPA: hypothetical protein VD865_13045 [Stenotrophomonas sp.]|nr:hypothetical protein [Stenotrophomonas sp.]